MTVNDRRPRVLQSESFCNWAVVIESQQIAGLPLKRTGLHATHCPDYRGHEAFTESGIGLSGGSVTASNGTRRRSLRGQRQRAAC